jgi:protein SCO1/2
MNLKLSALQKTLPQGVFLASFSVDPANDTPTVLAEYAKKFKAEAGKWLFFTGKMDEVNRLLVDLHLGKIDEPGAHSLRFILLDPKLNIRGYYDSTDDGSVAQLVRDAALLAKENK